MTSRDLLGVGTCLLKVFSYVPNEHRGTIVTRLLVSLLLAKFVVSSLRLNLLKCCI